MSRTLGPVNTEQPADIEEGTAQLSTPLQDAINKLQSMGISSPHYASTFRGEMPVRMTALDDEQLGDLLNDLSQWQSYVAEEVAKARCARDAAKTELEFIQARMRLNMRVSGNKLTVQDKNDGVLADPRVVKAQSQLLYHDAVYSLSKIIADTAQRNWDTVSRRITQRGQDIDRGRRDGNVAGAGRNASTTFHRRTT